ncbi:E3 ubiquitin-protein ligase RHF1A-like [Corylus avellana]|uniref:E3 ubiquitin-protein ligase RHF1A-like n=1 Tax=Corylus avellana TaxID=13451 RepID=UPI00286B3C7B|nr:E3 ubiquitin-protein ligase RHF1A-like [Corylus avellana]
MANITFPSSSSLYNPVVSAASSSSGAPEDAFEDGCSICLEPFTTADPATITSCKHEYHLHCILEWSQRSEECPICCQFVILKDPASQGLLAAVQIERRSRSRSRNISSAAPTSLRHFCEDFSVEHDASYSDDDSDFDERIMQHMAAAASRARYVSRRERQRSSGIVPSQFLVFTSPENTSQKTNATSAENFQNLSYVSPEGDSLSGIPSAINIQPQSSVDVNLVSSAAVNRDIPFKPRLLHSQPPPDTPRRPSTSEIFSFPETLKSKMSAASARYKESISKGTRGFKEKLLAHNNSVKELSKGVQREMTAGIAGVARMIERLDLSSKRTGSSVPVSRCTVGPSNLSFKGKGVEDKVDAQSLDKNSGLIGDDLSPDATYISGAIPGQPEIPHAQCG